MRDLHITNLLEERSFRGLSEAELEMIRAHVAQCAQCARAFRAARLSAQLLQQRAAATIEPSPFFQPRVMAAIREKAWRPEPVGLGKLWQASRALITAIAVLVVMLTALTFYSSSSQTALPDSTELISSLKADPTDPVDWMLDGAADSGGEDVGYGQVITTLYDLDPDAGGIDGNQQ